jgi:hypothetical protein
MIVSQIHKAGTSTVIVTNPDVWRGFGVHKGLSVVRAENVIRQARSRGLIVQVLVVGFILRALHGFKHDC